jgi:hypothetical protein
MPMVRCSASENLFCKVFESNAEREIEAMRQQIRIELLYATNPLEINVALCRTSMYIFVYRFPSLLVLCCMWLSS